MLYEDDIRHYIKDTINIRHIRALKIIEEAKTALKQKKIKSKTINYHWGKLCSLKSDLDVFSLCLAIGSKDCFNTIVQFSQMYSLLRCMELTSFQEFLYDNHCYFKFDKKELIQFWKMTKDSSKIDRLQFLKYFPQQHWTYFFKTFCYAHNFLTSKHVCVAHLLSLSDYTVPYELYDNISSYQRNDKIDFILTHCKISPITNNQVEILTERLNLYKMVISSSLTILPASLISIIFQFRFYCAQITCE